MQETLISASLAAAYAFAGIGAAISITDKNLEKSGALFVLVALLWFPLALIMTTSKFFDYLHE